MATKLDITRRDFLNGTALCLAAGTSLSPLQILALETADTRYPPLATGLRGSHPGSFEIAHALVQGGATYDRPRRQTDDTYDLIVVGGGISGLAAAFFYQQRAGAGARVLVLDNHDDFGGHAKRNEFAVDGRTLIGYGGSQSIDSPSMYSPASAGLLRDIGIDTGRFYDWFDEDFFSRRGSRPAIYFESGKYPRSATLPNIFGDYRGAPKPDEFDRALRAYPVSDDARAALRRLAGDARDYLDGMTRREKWTLLSRTSYSDFLRRHVGMPEEVVLLFRDTVKDLWGVGWDAVPASEALNWGMPGVDALGLDAADGAREEPYIFHFPDGNATIARALVRRLVPGAVDVRDIEALVTAKLDYAALDDADNACRIRLDSTAVDVRHGGDDRYVDVTYVRHGEVHRSRAKHAVLACYNAIVPHICPELPAEQAEAIRYAVKIPLVYLSIAVRNWQAWDRLGFHHVYVPQSDYMHSFGLDFPVSVGSYRFTDDPASATILHGSFIPTRPGEGLTDKEQARAGRQRLLEMSFDDHERQIVSQLDGALAAGGFDAARDIAAITVNRWPHGYAYEYNSLFEPPEFSPDNGPHVAGRAPLGRISIANSDASAYAYVDGAIDAADRAVTEQLARV